MMQHMILTKVAKRNDDIMNCTLPNSSDGTAPTKSNSTPQRLRWLSSLPFIFLAASLLLTVVLWKMYDKSLKERSQLIFNDRIDDVANKINVTMLGHQQMLRGAAALFSIKDDVSRADWRLYVAELHFAEKHPGLQGIGFSKLLTPAEKDGNIRKIRAEGFSEYTIRPAGDRPLYSSIIYLEPFDWRNQRAFGYDMYSEPVRRKAMEKARDENITTVAAKVILLQENGRDNQAGFLMYVPVYRKGLKLDTVAERRAACIGFAYSPVRMNDFVSASVQKLPEDIAFDIAVGGNITGKPTVDNLMYSRIQADKIVLPDNYTSAFTTTQTIEAFGNTWQFTFKTLPGFTKESNRTQSYLFLLAGILFSVVVSYLIREQLKKRDDKILESEENIVMLNERLTLAADSASLGVWDWLVPENRLIWDKRMFTLFGVQEKDFSGAYNAWQNGLHPDDRARGDEEINLALQGIKEFDSEFRVVRPSGEVRHIKGSGLVLRDPDGKPLRMIGVNYDITERKLRQDELEAQRIKLALQAEELRLLSIVKDQSILETIDVLVLLNAQKLELDESNRLLVASSHAKSIFMANMSHELRTPLHSIIGFSDVLQDKIYGELSEMQSDCVEDIISSGKHLLSLINDILDIAKVESGKMELQLGIFPLREILDNSLDMLMQKAQKKEICLSMDLAPQADMDIEADERKLKQILYNLLSNAVKFTPMGGTVSVVVEREGDYIKTAVVDSGIGIREEDFPKLFQPFTQLLSGDTKSFEGTGLGLALTKQLVELHGGRMWLTSLVGSGSTFSFTIPLTQNGGDNDDAADDTDHGGQKE